MNQTTFYILEIQLPSHHADELAQWFTDALDLYPTITERPDSTHAWVQATFPTELQACLARDALPPHIPCHGHHIRPTEPRDWATFWKHHFTPRNIGPRLTLRPVWDPGPETTPGSSPERIPILLDPGLSFGTGEHFTTRFCLEALQRALAHRPSPSLLDLGTGSGIIAIAARKLGIPSVTATDNDPVALQHTRANLHLNHCADNVTLHHHDILHQPVPGTYDIVCANILSSVLIQAAPAIARASTRLLLLSGIREQECDLVAAAYHDLGLLETGRDGDGEWAGLTLLRDQDLQPFTRTCTNTQPT
ncbi:MAG TPA: 50S ribosomal protein L11 methyltransferase [Kiritimatiellia bacterium]|nr:50S ribosomal protein L11 methyltransferase [Kiritimatiellia bacterium]